MRIYNKVYKRKKERSKLLSILVPRPGIEPGWIAPWCLRPARLPIPPSGQIPLCLFAVAKVLIIFELTNFLGTFFFEKCIFDAETLNFCCFYSPLY